MTLHHVFPVAPRQGSGDSKTTHLELSRYPIMALAIVAVASRFAHLRLGELRIVVLRSFGFLNTQNLVGVKAILLSRNPLKVVKAIIALVAVLVVGLKTWVCANESVKHHSASTEMETLPLVANQADHCVTVDQNPPLHDMPNRVMPALSVISHAPSHLTTIGNFVITKSLNGNPLFSHGLSISPHVTKAVA